MPQLIYRGDGEIQVGPHRLIKDQPVEISRELADELNRVPENLQVRGLEIILEPKPSPKTRKRENDDA